MEKITLGIEGMACIKCESHMNEAIKNNFTIESVTSSHSEKQTVIIAGQKIDDKELEEVVKNSGFELKSISREAYKKKGFLSSFKK